MKIHYSLAIVGLLLLTGCDSKPKKEEITLNEVLMPYNGKEEVYTSGDRIAPLTIKTSGNTNFLVKLKNYYSQKTAMTIFIKGGNTISTKVPIGSYSVVYASGNKWYGHNYLFGKETRYSKADSVFDFKQTYNGVNGYTITLYQVSGGNLSTSYLSPSEF